VTIRNRNYGILEQLRQLRQEGSSGADAGRVRFCLVFNELEKTPEFALGAGGRRFESARPDQHK